MEGTKIGNQTFTQHRDLCIIFFFRSSALNILAPEVVIAWQALLFFCKYHTAFTSVYCEILSQRVLDTHCKRVCLATVRTRTVFARVHWQDNPF